ncbi:MAG: hypothetical protein IPQ10_05965 [Saprospiraceae bacterium]|nr:hypothetical protein [Saprospiraceae bacterium]MBK7795491.1 hypothetical protein [Saprospiraceae bacterium]MBL0260603.1 hypothetical protein [Saprospiraceae bacterium]
MKKTRRDIYMRFKIEVHDFLLERGFEYFPKDMEYRREVAEGHSEFSFNVTYLSGPWFEFSYYVGVKFVVYSDIYNLFIKNPKDNWRYRSVYAINGSKLGLYKQDRNSEDHFSTEKQLIDMATHLKSNWNIVEDFYLANSSVEKCANLVFRSNGKNIYNLSLYPYQEIILAYISKHPEFKDIFNNYRSKATEQAGIDYYNNLKNALNQYDPNINLE